MKRFPLLSGLLILSLPVAAQAAERSYSVTDFERIRVTGPFKVVVLADRVTAVRGSGTADALDRVRLDVQGRTLFIRLDRRNFGGTEPNGPPALITIRAPALREASLAGSGSLSLSGMKGLRVALIVEGSGALTANKVQADRLDMGVIGSGSITTSGKALSATVTGRGAASVNAADLIVDDLTLNWESAGDGSFSAKRTAKVTSIGTGNVTVSGKPACTVTNGGNGQVSCGSTPAQ